MQYRTLVLAALLASACSEDPTGPEPGRFTASITGARMLELSGTSMTALVFSEAWPQGRYTISMSSPSGDRTRLVQIACPDTAFFQPRTYTLGEAESGCQGSYRLIEIGSDFNLLEEAVSITGSMTVTQVTATAVQGSFQFTGELSAEGDSNGQVTVEGVFNAARFP